MFRLLIGLIVVMIASACGGNGNGAGTGPTPVAPVAQPLIVIDERGQLAGGFDLLVNTDRGRTEWLTLIPEGLQAAYPSGQQFGFVGAVLLGPTAPGSRSGRDLSAYRTLQITVRGSAGGESIEVGIKDSDDPDTGAETKKTFQLTTSYQTLSMPLADFTTADLKKVYLFFEIVFSGASGRTVFFRDVRYVP
jgi:hypothetical protein